MLFSMDESNFLISIFLLTLILASTKSLDGDNVVLVDTKQDLPTDKELPDILLIDVEYTVQFTIYLKPGLARAGNIITFGNHSNDVLEVKLETAGGSNELTILTLVNGEMIGWTSTISLQDDGTDYAVIVRQFLDVGKLKREIKIDGDSLDIKVNDSPQSFRDVKAILGKSPSAGGVEIEKFKFYSIPTKVDGKWSEWSDWTHCSVTCGHGSQTRKRTCDHPSPRDGGDECLQSDKKTRNLTEIVQQDCPGKRCLVHCLHPTNVKRKSFTSKSITIEWVQAECRPPTKKRIYNISICFRNKTEFRKASVYNQDNYTASSLRPYTKYGFVVFSVSEDQDRSIPDPKWFETAKGTPPQLGAKTIKSEWRIYKPLIIVVVVVVLLASVVVLYVKKIHGRHTIGEALGMKGRRKSHHGESKKAIDMEKVIHAPAVGPISTSNFPA